MIQSPLELAHMVMELVPLVVVQEMLVIEVVAQVMRVTDVALVMGKSLMVVELDMNWCDLRMWSSIIGTDRKKGTGGGGIGYCRCKIRCNNGSVCR